MPKAGCSTPDVTADTRHSGIPQAAADVIFARHRLQPLRDCPGRQPMSLCQASAKPPWMPRPPLYNLGGRFFTSYPTRRPTVKKFLYITALLSIILINYSPDTKTITFNIDCATDTECEQDMRNIKFFLANYDYTVIINLDKDFTVTPDDTHVWIGNGEH